jgi:adhesin/invasin
MPTLNSITVLSGSGQTAQVNTAFALPITVIARDEFSNPLPGVTVDFAPPGIGVSGNFAGGNPSTVVTNGSGIAVSATLTADTSPGAWNVQVQNSASVYAWAAFTNSASPPTPVSTTVTITANGTQTAARNTAYVAVTARLLDQFGAGFPGQVVNMTCPTGTGTFPGGGITSGVVSDASGYVTFAVFTASSTLGAFSPVISSDGVTSVNASFNTIDPTVVVTLETYSGNHQVASPGSPFAQPLVVRATNAIGGVVSGFTVTLDAPDSGASLVWTSPATDPVAILTNVSGLATSPGITANATAGTYLVSASGSGVFTRYFELTNGGSAPASAVSALALCEV